MARRRTRRRSSRRLFDRYGPKTLSEYARSKEAKTRFEVFRIHLDRGGYDSRGKYYGIGKPLYRVYDQDGSGTYAVRAVSAEKAREEVIQNPGKWKERF